MTDQVNQEKRDIDGILTSLATFRGFDGDGFTRLVEDTNPKAGMKVLARFSKSIEGGIADIETGISTLNVEMIWKAAHKIAGTAELVGFTELGVVSKDLSHDMKGGTVEQFRPRVDSYLVLCRSALGAINAAFPRLQHYL